MRFFFANSGFSKIKYFVLKMCKYTRSKFIKTTSCVFLQTISV